VVRAQLSFSPDDVRNENPLAAAAAKHAAGSAQRFCGNASRGNRFAYVSVKRGEFRSDPPDLSEADIGTEMKQLAMTTDWAGEVREIERDGAAKPIWDKIYSEFAENDDETIVSATIDRGDVFMLRFQQLYALADHTITINKDHVRAAAALWKYSEASARYLFGSRLGDPKAEKTLDALRKHQEGLTRTEINVTIFKRNVKSERIDEALEILIRAGWIESRVEKTSGRDAERFLAKI
jgi:hypothetical protein